MSAAAPTLSIVRDCEVAPPIQPSISDSYTVSTGALCKAASLTPWSLWKHMGDGNLGKPQKRRGVRGNFWTPAQANKFLKRIGKPEQFGKEERS